MKNKSIICNCMRWGHKIRNKGPIKGDCVKEKEVDANDNFTKKIMLIDLKIISFLLIIEKN